MKNIKILFLTLVLLSASKGKSQIIIMNGDTVNNAVIPVNNRDTIYYCSSVNVFIQNNDTVGIAPRIGGSEYWGPTVPGKRILTTTSSFVPLSQDTTMGIVYAYYNNSHLGNWKDTSAYGWYHYDTTAEQFRWYSNDIHLIKKFPTSKICWITEDSNFSHNVIIWDTTGFAAENIDSVRIYYYISFNTRKLLATRPRIGSTYFVDSANNPQSGTFKYLLAGVNDCGNEDTNSAWQMTAWIQQSGATFTVTSPYTVKGISSAVSYYILYRDTTGSGHIWDSIFESPGTILNDPSYANYPNASYYVAAVLSLPGCSTPAIIGRMESMPANKSRSNRITNNLTGIAPVENENAFTVYPIPFRSSFSLHLQKESDVCVYDEMGQMIFHSVMQKGYHKVMLNSPTGLYLLNVNGSYKKLIKE